MMANFQYILGLFALWASSTVWGQNKYADKVRDCYLKDKAKMNDCLMQFWLEIKPILKNGLPELNVPPLDPMTIPNLEFSETGSVVQGTATFTNVKVLGLGDYTPKFVTLDKAKKEVKVALSIPMMRVTGDYSVDGNVLLLSVKGSGPFSMNLTGVDGIATASMVMKGAGVRASSIHVDFAIKSISVHLTGLLGGDTVGEAVNNMINDNSQSILEDVKPRVSQKLSEAITLVLADAFVDMPSEAFFD